LHPSYVKSSPNSTIGTQQLKKKKKPKQAKDLKGHRVEKKKAREEYNTGGSHL
jgi:hypothetical protein